MSSNRHKDEEKKREVQFTRRRFIGGSIALVGAPTLGSLLAACGGDDDETAPVEPAPEEPAPSGEPAPEPAPTPAEPVPTEAGTLTLGFGSPPAQVDPTNFTGNDMEYTTGNVYATPLRFVQADLGRGYPEIDTENPTVEPWLAESFEASADLRTFRLTLQDNVTSFSGNPLTTEDVRWTIERNIQTPGNGSIIVALAGMSGPQNINVIDEKVIELQPDEPSRLMPLLLQNMFGFGIVDSTEAKNHATPDDEYATEWLAQNTAGFGPYHMTELTPQQASFVPNPNYFGPAPTYTDVKWLGIPESANRLSLLQAGDLGAIFQLDPQQIKALEGSNEVQLVTSGKDRNWDALYLNTNFPSLADPRVRQALAYAVPYDGILEAVYQGTAGSWQTPIGGVQYAGADASLNPYETDLGRAQELLDSAGASDVGVTITFENTQFWQEDVAIQLQTSWREIGVTAELEGVAPAVWGERLGARDMEVFMVSVGALVPDIFYEMSLWYLSTSGLNFGAYANGDLDTVIEQGLAEPDPGRRVELARTAQEILLEDVPMLAVAVRNPITAIRSEISGYTGWVNHMVYWADLAPVA